MVYIKVDGENVALSGQVASEQMIKDGYFLADIPDSKYLKWDTATSTVVVDTVAETNAFNEVKQAKIAEIKTAYQNQLKQGYICSNGINMDAEQDKVNLLKNGYDLAVKTNQTTMDIRDYDNVVHTGIALADVDTMLTELGVNISTQLAKKWQLEDQVQAATTQTELDLIVW